MTHNPRGNNSREAREETSATVQSPVAKPGPSETPPPFSLPNNEVDSAWEDSKEHRAKEASGRIEASRRPDRSHFTPSFTLRGSGPLDASKQAGLLALDSRFGVYVVGPCIGEGGMARIYQAEHSGLRRQVALKVLIDGFARDLDGRERFLREARLAAAIKHPNVVNIFDVGVQDDIPYLVMELLEGQDLEKLLESKGALDEGAIIDIMIPVVAGLVAVHDAGIVHRDLKPGNIFLAKGRYSDLEPKLLDFGISKAQGPEQLRLTANRGVMGTPFYISPEGLHGGEMTPRSDQYSLAVVMYECATGFTPYKASAFAELSRLILSGQYTPPTAHKPELSKRLARIIERAMSLQPQQRYKDMREMGRELLALAGQRTRITWGLSFGELKREAPPPSPDGQQSGDAPPPSQGPPSSSRNLGIRPWIAPMLLLLVGLCAWFALFAWRSGMVSFHPASRPIVVQGATETPPETQRATPPAATAVAEPTPESNEHAPVAAAAVPTGPPPVNGKGTSATESSGKSATRSADTRATRSESATTNARRYSRPSAARRTTGSGSDTEDWALPAAASSAGPANAQVGANDSPIFD